MKKNAAAILFLLYCALAFPQGQKSIDSLNKLLSTETNPARISVIRMKLVDKYMLAGDLKDAERQYYNILRESKRDHNDSNLAIAYHNLFGLLFQRNEVDSAKLLNDTLLKLALRTNNKQKIIESLNNNGSFYYTQNDYKKALVFYDSALRVEARFGFQEGQYASLNNIGLIYLESKIPRMAVKYFKKSVKRNMDANKKRSLIYSYESLSDAYNMLARYDSALYYAYRALDVALSSNNVPKTAHSHCAIGNAFKSMKQYDSAEVHFNKAIEINNNNQNDGEIFYLSYSGLAETYYKQNRLKEASKMAERLKALGDEFTTIYEQKQLYNIFGMLEYQNKNYKKAYDYLEGYMVFQDSCYNTEVSAQISDINTKYETEKKERENQLLQAQNQLSSSAIKQQRTVIIFVIVGLLITLALLYFIFRGLKNQKQANRIISEQKHLVEEKQKEILDSIHYAKRIQNTLLAHADFVNEHLPHNFILFKPKDIVSGDFYWATKRDNLFYLAVCDSTGHGVPGAFMSLLNIGFLNEAINEKDIVEPDKIFNHVRERLVNSISKEGQKDGFDGILLCIDLTTKKISYAAANNAPVIVSAGEATYCDCDKMPVGKGERDMAFTLHHIELKNSDTLYLYTDGYADQFGGPKGKKFMYKQLNLLLAGNSAKPLNEQKELLDQRFEEWRSLQEQVDDVCVIGIRL